MKGLQCNRKYCLICGGKGFGKLVKVERTGRDDLKILGARRSRPAQEYCIICTTLHDKIQLQ